MKPRLRSFTIKRLTNQRLFTLEVCCGYEHDLARGQFPSMDLKGRHGRYRAVPGRRRPRDVTVTHQNERV